VKPNGLERGGIDNGVIRSIENVDRDVRMGDGWAADMKC
jgi:hypothetical protein